MREIQFRAWDKKDQYWMAEEWVANQPIWQLDTTNSRYEWMQWTGLHDRHGVEIYEGDIVKTNLRERIADVEIGVIEYHWGEFEVVNPSYRNSGVALNSYTYVGDGTRRRRQPTVRVIGNIWQNPELLK